MIHAVMHHRCNDVGIVNLLSTSRKCSQQTEQLEPLDGVAIQILTAESEVVGDQSDRIG